MFKASVIQCPTKATQNDAHPQRTFLALCDDIFSISICEYEANYSLIFFFLFDVIQFTFNLLNENTMQYIDENFLVIPLQEIQQEKDNLQERMSEQLMKISSLQTRLDEQRLRAEELNKQSNSDLTIRVHDLQNELSSLRETLTTRDKQVTNLNQLLEHSKKIIDRQEHELALSGDNDKSLLDRLEDQLKIQSEEIQRLKDKIKTEMINKVALPDLMETMMAEKNEEIENLQEQLINKEREIMTQQKSVEQTFVRNDTNSTPPASCIGGTVLSMISEYDEPDTLRRMLESGAQFALPPQYQVRIFYIKKFFN